MGQLDEKGEEMKQKKPHRLKQHYGDYQRERGWEEVEEGKGGIHDDGKRLDLGW